MTASKTVRWVALYKTAKAICGLLASATLGTALLLGAGTHLHHLALLLREHATSALATHLADLLLTGTTNHALTLATLALALDATLTALEAWALRTGKTWGEWLVVAATSLLLPLELYELTHHPSPLRLLVLLTNLAVALTLAHHAHTTATSRSP